MESSQRWDSGFGILALTSTALASALTLTHAEPAQAQAAYGSYIGVGVAVGLTEDDLGNGDSFSGVIAGRYRLLEAPISIRGQALIFGDSSAFVPTVSYDFPLNWQTDVYVGAGVSFVANGDEPSPVGDQTAFVIQPGIDYTLPNSKLVVFGNAIIAFDAYREGGDAALSLQGGVGFQF